MGDQDKNYEQLQRQALAESEEKYRRLVETTDTGYLILDEDGRVVDANSEYVRLTGHRSLSEILGREVAQWTASHDAARSAQKVEECLERGAVRQLEIDYLGPEGELTPVGPRRPCVKVTTNFVPSATAWWRGSSFPTSKPNRSGG
jgi:PAS domain S-box-containing protein